MNKEFWESQIDQRRRSDSVIFQDAFSDLLSIIGINTNKAAKQATGAAAEILKYLGKEVPEVPESITSLDSQLEYMLRPSNTMRRRVELKGEWWKDATGCLLGGTTDGDVIAILPDTWSGYYYINQNGEKIKINKNTAKNIRVDAFCFYKSFPLKSLKIRDLIKFMVSSVTKLDIMYILGITLIVSLLNLLNPYVTGIIYNTLIPSGKDSLIFPVAAFLFGVTVTSMLIGITKSIIMGRFRPLRT